MTESTKRHHRLILDLVACYADHPDKIRLTAAELVVRSNGVPSSVYWRMQTSGDDYGKLAGRAGANVHALEFLVFELGSGADSDYHFQLLNPSTPAPDRKSDTAPDIVEDYDCAPMVDLIGRVVAEIAAHKFKVTADGVILGRKVLTHRLTVAFDNQDDHEYFREEVLEAVNTLLRAMHRKQGALLELACVLAKKEVEAK